MPVLGQYKLILSFDRLVLNQPAPFNISSNDNHMELNTRKWKTNPIKLLNSLNKF